MVNAVYGLETVIIVSNFQNTEDQDTYYQQQTISFLWVWTHTLKTYEK